MYSNLISSLGHHSTYDDDEDGGSCSGCDECKEFDCLAAEVVPSS